MKAKFNRFLIFFTFNLFTCTFLSAQTIDDSYVDGIREPESVYNEITGSNAMDNYSKKRAAFAIYKSAILQKGLKRAYTQKENRCLKNMEIVEAEFEKKYQKLNLGETQLKFYSDLYLKYRNNPAFVNYVQNKFYSKKTAESVRSFSKEYKDYYENQARLMELQSKANDKKNADYVAKRNSAVGFQILLIGVIVLIIYLIYSYYRMCPKCKRKHAMFINPDNAQQRGTYWTHNRNISRQMFIYSMEKRCKFCGYNKYVTRHRAY